MILVTVGTHEQQFNRLVKYIDELKIKNRITEDVVIQTGYSTYKPKACQWSNFYPYQEMVKYVDKARIVITHGGPSSFVMPLQIGKIPVVVPRQKEFYEHVNNHQMDFCRAVVERYGNIIVIENIEKLGDIIKRYDSLIATMSAEMKSNNTVFCKHFEEIVCKLF